MSETASETKAATPSMGFWRSAFSESDGSGSSSRVISAWFSAISGLAVAYLTYKHGALPDPGTLIGLAGFSASAYTVNKVTSVASDSITAKATAAGLIGKVSV